MAYKFNPFTGNFDDFNGPEGEFTSIDVDGDITIGGTGRVSFPLGLAATPSMYPGTDTNTGIYSPGADQLAVSTGGTGRLFVDASGNVGVGTASPNASSKLHVADGDVLISKTSGYASLFFNFIGVGTSRAGAIKKNYDSPYDLRIQGGNNPNQPAPICFDREDGFENARFDDSGRFLVGTSSDSGGALFQVNGDRIRVGTAKTPATSGATGTTGEIAWDADYIYVCTATNTWKRSAIATW